MEFQFEATRSFCYKFGRYTVLAEVQRMSEVTCGEKFRLTDLTQRVIDKYLTPEQQQVKVKKAQSDRLEPVHSIVKFFASFIAKEQEIFVKVGDGLYRSQTAEDISDVDLDESALADGDEDTAEFEGWIYAFSFPSLVRVNEPFPIKIGKTVCDVEGRVAQEGKGQMAGECAGCRMVQHHGCRSAIYLEFCGQRLEKPQLMRKWKPRTESN